MKHLRPINLSGGPPRRRMNSAPSLSCEAPRFDYPIFPRSPSISDVAEGIRAKKDKAAA